RGVLAYTGYRGTPPRRGRACDALLQGVLAVGDVGARRAGDRGVLACTGYRRTPPRRGRACDALLQGVLAVGDVGARRVRDRGVLAYAGYRGGASLDGAGVWDGVEQGGDDVFGAA